MIYRVAVLSALLVVAMLFSRPALSQISILNGECRDSSHTAEGPIGSDLTKRQSRFYCDSAVLTYFDDQIGHVMIQFAQKASGNAKILGFAGQVQTDGIMVWVDHVYLEQGQATAVDDGWCKFFKNDEKRKITGIACGMKRNKAGRRSTAIVEFHAMPDQTSSFKASPDGPRNAQINQKTTQSPGSVTPSDEIYRPHPGEAYAPAIYCEWNRTGLPLEQQKICRDRDIKNPPKLYKAKPGERLETLLPNCQASETKSCNDDFFQPVWKRIEADNGAVSRVDMNSIRHLPGGTTEVTVYTGAPHTMFDSTKLNMLWFDCRGSFRAFDGGMGQSPQLDAPPRSIAGEIAHIVCTK